MSVKERLKQYIDYKKISISAFCKGIGVSNAYVSSMNKSIQPDKIESITLNYPDLNTGWLLTGEGEMLKNAPLPSPSSCPSCAVMMREVALLEKTVAELKSENKELVAQNAVLNYRLNVKP